MHIGLFLSSNTCQSAKKLFMAESENQTTDKISMLLQMTKGLSNKFNYLQQEVKSLKKAGTSKVILSWSEVSSSSSNELAYDSSTLKSWSRHARRPRSRHHCSQSRVKRSPSQRKAEHLCSRKSYIEVYKHPRSRKRCSPGRS